VVWVIEGCGKWCGVVWCTHINGHFASHLTAPFRIQALTVLRLWSSRARAWQQGRWYSSEGKSTVCTKYMLHVANKIYAAKYMLHVVNVPVTYHRFLPLLSYDLPPLPAPTLVLFATAYCPYSRMICHRLLPLLSYDFPPLPGPTLV
jgi:hypothetical protein